jgi:hypothetical protein
MAEWTEAADGLQDEPRCAAFVAQLLLLPKGRLPGFGPKAVPMPYIRMPP